jgi:hypothetical protein
VTHLCHAVGCSVEVDPRMLMCLRHWRLVPPALKARVWAAYVPGQEVRKDPTAHYLDEANAAIYAVVERELGHPVEVATVIGFFGLTVPGAPPAAIELAAWVRAHPSDVRRSLRARIDRGGPLEAAKHPLAVRREAYLAGAAPWLSRSVELERRDPDVFKREA